METLHYHPPNRPVISPRISSSSSPSPSPSPSPTRHQQHQTHFVGVIKPRKSSILTRLHAGYFRITLSLASQALLWKILEEPITHDHDDHFSQPLSHFFRILPPMAFHFFWCFALLAHISLSCLYILRCCFHFHLVKAEFFHYVGVNYLFAPWISWLVLLQSAPLVIPKKVTYLVLWWVFAVPVILLDVKIYGQWFTTEKRFLSMVANPTSQISVIGNLVGARAAAQMGWKESALCMFSLGMAHYLVLFVTLYQRLSGGDRLPALLRPVFFLFFAAPSMASLAWNSITGAFDTGSKMLFFLSLFLFASLACRPALFKKSMKKFNVAWWAYSFPLTFLALASIEYAHEVRNPIATVLVLALSTLSFLVFIGLMLLTMLKTDTLLREDDPILRFDKSTRERN